MVIEEGKKINLLHFSYLTPRTKTPKLKWPWGLWGQTRSKNLKSYTQNLDSKYIRHSSTAVKPESIKGITFQSTGKVSAQAPRSRSRVKSWVVSQLSCSNTSTSTLPQKFSTIPETKKLQWSLRTLGNTEVTAGALVLSRKTDFQPVAKYFFRLCSSSVLYP